MKSCWSSYPDHWH